MNDSGTQWIASGVAAVMETLRWISCGFIRRRRVFVPEVFTPDGNGKNDTWMITWLGGVDPGDFTMQLFNEAGGKVLEMDGLRQDFDGGSLRDGVYWWVLRDRAGRDLQAGVFEVKERGGC